MSRDFLLQGHFEFSQICIGALWLANKFANLEKFKMTPVSTTSAANFATGTTGVMDIGGKVATRVNDTCGKFAAGVSDSGGELPPESLTLEVNLPPVSTTVKWTVYTLKWTCRKKIYLHILKEVAVGLACSIKSCIRLTVRQVVFTEVLIDLRSELCSYWPTQNRRCLYLVA
jgi:hypothetical protein